MLMLINILILFFVVLIIYQAIYVNPLLEGMKFNSKNNKKTKEGLEGQALEDHDELIRLKSQVKDKLLPLVENSKGKQDDTLNNQFFDGKILMTETLANLYSKQGNFQKAVEAYKILSLKYPKKSIYFANQINKIKEIT